jgi:hypothetical protein
MSVIIEAVMFLLGGCCIAIFCFGLFEARRADGTAVAIFGVAGALFFIAGSCIELAFLK